MQKAAFQGLDVFQKPFKPFSNVVKTDQEVENTSSGGYRGVAMVSAETPSENSVHPKFIDKSSCG